MVTDHEMRMEALRLFEENERLRAALEQSMSEWKPIATAPKDGRIVLICGFTCGASKYFVADAKWDGDWMLFHPDKDDWTEPCFAATHWQPLPAPPVPSPDIKSAE